MQRDIAPLAALPRATGVDVNVVVVVNADADADVTDTAIGGPRELPRTVAAHAHVFVDPGAKRRAVHADVRVRCACAAYGAPDGGERA